MTKSDQTQIVTQLREASNKAGQYVLENSGWFKFGNHIPLALNLAKQYIYRELANIFESLKSE